MSSNDVIRYAIGAALLAIVIGVIVFLCFLARFAAIKRHYREAGLSRGNANFLFEMRSTKDWKTLTPVLALAVTFWPGVSREVKEGFERRMETFKEQLGEFWLPMSVSVAHDVRTAIEAGEGEDSGQRYLDILEEALPRVDDVAEYCRLTMEFGLVSATVAAKDGLPLDYARAMFPPAPTFARPLSKQEYFRGEYTPRDAFEFKKAAAVIPLEYARVLALPTQDHD